MILGVVMIIRNGVRFVAAMGEESERTSIAKTIGYIALGIILSLLSVVIINLLQSITQSSITDEPTPIAYGSALPTASPVTNNQSSDSRVIL